MVTRIPSRYSIRYTQYWFFPSSNPLPFDETLPPRHEKNKEKYEYGLTCQLQRSCCWCSPKVHTGLCPNFNLPPPVGLEVLDPRINRSIGPATELSKIKIKKEYHKWSLCNLKIQVLS